MSLTEYHRQTEYSRQTRRGLLLRQLSAARDHINPEAPDAILRAPWRFGGRHSGLVGWAILRWLAARKRQHTRRKRQRTREAA